MHMHSGLSTGGNRPAILDQVLQTKGSGVATFTSNFASLTGLESLLTEARNYQVNNLLYLDSTAASFNAALLSNTGWTTTSFSDTSVTSIYNSDNLTLSLYGTNFATQTPTITSIVISDGTATMTMAGSVTYDVPANTYIGGFSSLDFQSQGYTEHVAGYLPLDGSADSITSWSSTYPTELGAVTLSATGTLTPSSPGYTAYRYTSVSVSDDAGHTATIAGLSYDVISADNTVDDPVAMLHDMLAGNDTVEGSAGSDWLDGFAGADTMAGGIGNDIYVVDDVGDVVTEALNEGSDTVQSAISYTLGSNVENLVLVGATAIDGSGNAGDNTLTGNSVDNTLDGGDGNDTLYGGAGNDTLIGGLGVDSFAGGAGDDIYVVDDAYPATILMITGQPGEYITQGLSYTFTSQTGDWSAGLLDNGLPGDGIVDYLSVVYNDTTNGSFFNLSLGTNNLGTNLVPGTYLDAQRAPFAAPGHPGLDFSMDGRGNNEAFGSFAIQSIDVDYSGASPVLLSLSATFSVSGQLTEPPLYGYLRYNSPAIYNGEQVTELANEGTDHVISSVSYALSDNIENLTLSGTAAIDGAGNTLDNVLAGNANDNILTGGDGNDVFAFAANGNGLDTITDFSQGDSITVAGAAFTGAITAGDGSAVLANQVQLASSGGTTTLYIGTDATAGADVQIQLTGTFQANALVSYGNTIALNNLPTGSVTITGIPAQGQTLTAGNILADIDGLGVIGYQWQADGTNISGATAGTYTLTQAEVGKAVTVTVGYTDGHGTVESVVSAATAVVTLSVAAKIYITDQQGNYIDWSAQLAGFSVLGKGVQLTGGAGDDMFYLQAGTSADISNLGGGINTLHLTGNLADYAQTIDQQTGVYTLTRTTGLPAGQNEVVQFTVGDKGDIVYFADGQITINAASDPRLFDGAAFQTIQGGWLTAGGTPASPVTTAATAATNPAKVYIVDAQGLDVPALMQPGQAMEITGSGAVDTVYVNAGTSANAANLGGGDDRIYLPGNLADYQQSIDQDTGVYHLTRNLGLPAGQSETIAFTVGDQNDVIYFADGHITVNAGADTRLYDPVSAQPFQSLLTEWLLAGGTSPLPLGNGASPV